MTRKYLTPCHRVANPKAMIPDSLMSLTFQGLPDAQQRADVIAYLKTQTQ